MLHDSKLVSKEVERTIEQIKKLEGRELDDIDEEIQLIEQLNLLFFKVSLVPI